MSRIFSCFRCAKAEVLLLSALCLARLQVFHELLERSAEAFVHGTVVAVERLLSAAAGDRCRNRSYMYVGGAATLGGASNSHGKTGWEDPHCHPELRGAL